MKSNELNSETQIRTANQDAYITIQVKQNTALTNYYNNRIQVLLPRAVIDVLKKKIMAI